MRDRCVTLVEEDLRGARVLDLFAGSGALGLEALSRGARSVDFVENGPAALHALKANVAALRATKACRLFKKDALPWVRGLEAGAYGVAFVDPPYGSKKLDRILERWREVPFANVLVVEHDKEHEVASKGKRYDFGGPTRVTILRSRGKRSVGRRAGGRRAGGGVDGPASPTDRPPNPSPPQNARPTRTKRFRPGR